MGQTTVKPEHKPEQRGKTERNWDVHCLALRFCVLGNPIQSDGRKHAPDGLAQQDGPFLMDGLTVMGGSDVV